MTGEARDRPGTELLLGQATELALLARRAYQLRPDGVCQPLAEQPDLRSDLEDDGELLVADTECWAFKEACDLVVKASAWAPGGKPVTGMEASVDVQGRTLARLRVSGPRKVALRGDTISFTSPEPFESVELNYGNAYGGVDEVARPKLDAENIDLLRPFLHGRDLSSPIMSMAAYRRNTAGKGYVVAFSPELDGLALPEIEDPADLLTPERLVTGDQFKWHRQPVPAGVDWFSYAWFPRVVFLGAWSTMHRADMPGPDDPPPREFALGTAPPDAFEHKSQNAGPSARFMNGASPALILPAMRGDEEITLRGMDPEHPEFIFRLPGEVPALWIQPLGQEPIQARPFLGTVLVEKDLGRVSLVWSGRVRAKWPHASEQLERVRFAVRW